MNERSASVVQIVLLALVFLGLLGYWLSSCNDCEHKGGVLIRDANGFYQCIPKAPEP